MGAAIFSPFHPFTFSPLKGDALLPLLIKLVEFIHCLIKGSRI